MYDVASIVQMCSLTKQDCLLLFLWATASFCLRMCLWRIVWGKLPKLPKIPEAFSNKSNNPELGSALILTVLITPGQESLRHLAGSYLPRGKGWFESCQMSLDSFLLKCVTVRFCHMQQDGKLSKAETWIVSTGFFTTICCMLCFKLFNLLLSEQIEPRTLNYICSWSVWIFLMPSDLLFQY